jgi:RsiW-degrading membrane proteinase PrsW (M82 family)
MALDPSKKSLWRTARTVAWSFVGLGGRAAYDKESKNLNPIHIIVVGLIGVFVFVAVLVLLVNWMVVR